MTALRTPKSTESQTQMPKESVMHRVAILQQNFDNADPQKLARELTEADIEKFDNEARKILIDLIPLAGALLVPQDLEEVSEAKAVLDQLGTGESTKSGLKPENNDESEISDESLKNAIAGFRSLFMVLEAFGIDNLPERTINKLRAAMATLIAETGYPLPPELLDRLTFDDYRKLQQHINLQKMADNCPSPVTIQEDTNLQYKELLGITEWESKNRAEEEKQYEAYLEFLQTHGDPAFLSVTILPPNSTSENR